MTKLFLIVLAISGFSAGAQTLPNFDLIKLEKAPDYKMAEPFALQTANYLLSSPIRKDDKDRLNSLRFLGKWMYGTPDFSFVVGDMASKLGKDNNDVIGLYMAGMVKYTLENRANSKDTKQVRLNAVQLVLNYCDNKDNNIRIPKQLKKLAEAKQSGQLEQALDQ